jgi:hypothetical protein
MQVVGFVSPDAISIFQSINVLAVIVIGGLASIVGSVIGGAAMIFLPSDGPRLVVQIPFIDAFFNIDDIRRSPGAIQGAIVIITIILLPTGIAGGLERLRRLQPTAVMDAVRTAPARALERAGAARAQYWRRPGNRGRSGRGPGGANDSS